MEQTLAAQEHERDLERLRAFRLIDDDFLTKCFEDGTACIELVLRIVMEKPDLVVEDVRTQQFVENLLKRSVRMDVVASDSKGVKYDIEIQREDKGAGKRRARYNSSMLDAGLLKKGEDFDLLPEAYVIFITEHDVLKMGLPVYHIEKCIMEAGIPFDDGSHILYVNGAFRDDSPIGRLMHDFSCTGADDMHYDILADRVRFFKESKEGVAIMCKAMEDMRNQSWREGVEHGRKEGIREGGKAAALRMLNDGKYELDEIANISGLSLEEVNELQASHA